MVLRPTLYEFISSKFDIQVIITGILSPLNSLIPKIEQSKELESDTSRSADQQLYTISNTAKLNKCCNSGV
jgi:hypothetical protein